jgi:hypothetical protein
MRGVYGACRVGDWSVLGPEGALLPWNEVDR